MALTEEERGQMRADVVTAVSEAIVATHRPHRAETWPDEETRVAHHRFIARWIEKQERRERFKERMKGNVVILILTATFSGIGAAGLWLLDNIKFR